MTGGGYLNFKQPRTFISPIAQALGLFPSKKRMPIKQTTRNARVSTIVNKDLNKNKYILSADYQVDSSTDNLVV